MEHRKIHINLQDPYYIHPGTVCNKFVKEINNFEYIIWNHPFIYLKETVSLAIWIGCIIMFSTYKTSKCQAVKRTLSEWNISRYGYAMDDDVFFLRLWENVWNEIQIIAYKIGGFAWEIFHVLFVCYMDWQRLIIGEIWKRR